MRLYRISSVTGRLLASALMAGTGLGQSLVGSGAITNSGPTITRQVREPELVVRAFPKANLGNHHEVRYVGSYCPDGRYRAVSARNHLSGGLMSQYEGALPARPVEVPPSVELKSNNRLVPDFEPPAHAVAAAKGHSAIGEARDFIVRFVYGREWILRNPRYVTTDSNERLIISDPAIPAVHVLNVKNRESFRIVGGKGRRIHVPAGVAVDGENNIYVAEAERGIVLVYAPDGSFLRAIGDLGGSEGLFHDPSSIVVAPKIGRLYVLDGPRLFMLDLAGKILKRVGSSGREMTLPNAKDIALNGEELLVLDSGGTRIQVFDLDLKFRRIVSLVNAPVAARAALGVDSNGDIYVSGAGASVVRIYSHDGAFLNSFGGWGTKMGELNSPAGVWFGPKNRMYVADSGNVRVQVFEIRR